MHLQLIPNIIRSLIIAGWEALPVWSHRWGDRGGYQGLCSIMCSTKYVLPMLCHLSHKTFPTFCPVSFQTIQIYALICVPNFFSPNYALSFVPQKISNVLSAMYPIKHFQFII